MRNFWKRINKPLPEPWKMWFSQGINIFTLICCGVVAWLIGVASHTGLLSDGAMGYWWGGLITGVLASTVYWMLVINLPTPVKRTWAKYQQWRKGRHGIPSSSACPPPKKH